MIGRVRIGVEVEQHTAGILVHKRGLGGTGFGGHLNLAGLGTNGYCQLNGASVGSGDFNGIHTGELDRQRSKEIGTADGDLLSGRGPFVGHSFHLGGRRQHLEVVQHHGTVAGDQVHLVVLDGGQILRNRHHDGVGCHVTGIQDGRLVVEVDIVNTGEIVTYDTDGLLHVGLGNGHIPVGITDKVHGGNTLGLLEAIRIIQCRARGKKGQAQQDTCIFCHCFHGFRN